MEIRSKRQFYAEWRAGTLGNRPHTWTAPHEAWNAGFASYGFRESGKAGGGRFQIVPRLDFWPTVASWDSEGRTIVIDGGAPNELVQLQGEVCRTERGLEGFLAIRTGMDIRSALRAGLFMSCSPLKTKILLEHFMDASSRDDLESLLDLYPDAAIEFACFQVNVGVIPHRNTIIWEVRNY